MKPIKFKEQNVTFGKPADMTDEQCSSLPAYRGDGDIISLWKLSFIERIKILFTGRLWFCVHSLSQPPIWFDVNNPFI